MHNSSNRMTSHIYYLGAFAFGWLEGGKSKYIKFPSFCQHLKKKLWKPWNKLKVRHVNQHSIHSMLLSAEVWFLSNPLLMAQCIHVWVPVNHCEQKAIWVQSQTAFKWIQDENEGYWVLKVCFSSTGKVGLVGSGSTARWSWLTQLLHVY